MFLLKLKADAEAADACRAAKGLNPIAASYVGLGTALFHSGDLDAASVQLNECISRFPRATGCMIALAHVQQLRGMCAEGVATLQKAIDVAPDESDVRRLFAKAVFGRDMTEDRGTSHYRSAVEDYVARLPSEGATVVEIEAERGYYESVALVAEGQLEHSLDALERVMPSYRAGAMEVDIASIWLEELRILVELGRKADAVALARRWITEREAWVPSAYMNTKISPLATLYRLGALSRPAFEEERRKWDSDAKKSGFSFRPQLWAAAYGEAVLSLADAEEALVALPRYGPFPPPRRDAEVDATVGAALLRAGRVNDALPWLRGATGCDPMQGLLFFFQAFADLGDALTATDDRIGACNAYGVVLEHWGSTTGSVTAIRARARRAALHCP